METIKDLVLVRSDKPLALYKKQGAVGDFAMAGISPLVKLLGVCGPGGRLEFLARITDVEAVPMQVSPTAKRQPARFRVHFDEYAEVGIDRRVWDPDRRNPVHYTSLAEIHAERDVAVNMDELVWRPVGAAPAPSEGLGNGLEQGIDIPTAKRLIALRMGISPDQVEILIRG